MIVGNTYVILVYRYFNTYSIGICNVIYGQMPMEYVSKYLYTKITKVLPRIMPNHAYRY